VSFAAKAAAKDGADGTASNDMAAMMSIFLFTITPFNATGSMALFDV
jgi:hypothetical protein